MLLAHSYHSLGSLLMNMNEYVESDRLLLDAKKMSGELAAEFPDVPGHHLVLADTCYATGMLQHVNERREDADTSFRLAIDTTIRLAKDYPNAPKYSRQLAWYLATCPAKQLRNSVDAVEFATKAVKHAPKAGHCWTALGVARYRNGERKEAIDALEMAAELTSGGSPTEWLFLAMSHWQLGQKNEAREWYDRAATWMKEKDATEELARFRAEADELFGIEDADGSEMEPQPEEGEEQPVESAERP
jgi:tetratricopeptide (TPR) repeat protein